MYVCVCESEFMREKACVKQFLCVSERVSWRVFVCVLSEYECEKESVFVCVCEREREREVEIEKAGG